MNENSKKESVTEKNLHPFSGGAALVLLLLGLIASIGGIVYSSFLLSSSRIVIGAILLTTSIIAVLVVCILLAGLKIVGPNEARVFTLFGKYYGTIQKPGFFYVNPFVCSINPVKTSTSSITIGESTAAVQVKANISTKTMTLSNEKQKVNDVLGNPVIIGSVVIWNVENPTKAVFNVENYSEYLSIQCDSTIRHIARLYPYDNIETDSEEKTLRGSSQEIADIMQKDLQERVRDAGLNIQEVRITHLAYSEEIAAAMLQRQQASAIIAARQKIVEGAVSMVKMAIDQLGEEEIVVLDEERKAAMVSNLLVVLCGNKDAQPIVNSGSIY
ncbi:MAG: SPFH domain-containing protein [Lachnospiraceae bacterium]|nr:SPFH domain-containing protein [Lachnospiraceae bacterium]MCI8825855.1 SPFH domain-containing protein [Lachnospiraceae bacterium]